MSSNLKIEKIQVREDKELNKRNERIPYPLPKHKQHLLICGGTMSGKTNLMANMLLKFYRNQFDRVYVFSPSYHSDILPNVIDLPEEQIFDTYSDEKLLGIIKYQKEQIKKKKPEHSLIIFDDNQHSFKRSGILEDFLSKARQSNLTVWVVCQYLKAVPPKVRSQVLAFILINQKSKDLKIADEEMAPDDYLLDKYEIVRQSDNKYDFLYVNYKTPHHYFFNFEEEI